MFKRWKEARQRRKAAKIEAAEREARIRKNAFLRRLRNSIDTLSGLSHSGTRSQLDHTLEISEVRWILRRHLDQMAKDPTDVEDENDPE
jgi:hypothetical protein